MRLASLLLGLTLACTAAGTRSGPDAADALPDPGPADPGGPDADPGPDAAAEVAAPADVAAETIADRVDEPATGIPLPGFGALTGACGVFDEVAWADDGPRFVLNHLDFGADPFDDADYDLLTAGGRRIFDDDNAGGSSKMSEIFAFEVLARCEAAILLKTELEIDYLDPQGKITDLLVQVDGRRLGVSVTRAMSWPHEAAYDPGAAAGLLEKKLSGIRASSANVAPADAWVRQALSVLAFGEAHAEVLQLSWEALPSDLRADTWLVVTVTDGDDLFLY